MSFAENYQQSLAPTCGPRFWFGRWVIVAVASDGHRYLLARTFTHFGASRSAIRWKRDAGRFFAFIVERAP